jgi:hypothetical protein
VQRCQVFMADISDHLCPLIHLHTSLFLFLTLVHWDVRCAWDLCNQSCVLPYIGRERTVLDVCSLPLLRNWKTVSCILHATQGAADSIVCSLARQKQRRERTPSPPSCAPLVFTRPLLLRRSRLLLAPPSRSPARLRRRALLRRRLDRLCSCPLAPRRGESERDREPEGA